MLDVVGLRDGPLVIASPPNLLGLINELFGSNYVTDIGQRWTG